MGTIIEASCSKCGYHAKLFTGGGMRDCNPEAAIAALPQNVPLAAALKNNARFQIERRAAVCGRCRKLAVAVRVEYQSGNAPKQRAENVCPDCGGALVPVAPDAKNVPCPACGMPISMASVGHWD